MLQVARLSPKQLGDSKDLILAFLGREQVGGAFRDRSGNPDLYYTVFGLEAMLALQLEPPAGKVAEYLNASAKAGPSDFVHACSLARCGAARRHRNIRPDRLLAQTVRLLSEAPFALGAHGNKALPPVTPPGRSNS